MIQAEIFVICYKNDSKRFQNEIISYGKIAYVRTDLNETAKVPVSWVPELIVGKLQMKVQ